MKKIAFTSNIYNEGFSMIGQGLKIVCKETGRVINRAVHSKPYLFMFIELLVIVTIAFIYIGQARAERDNASKRLITEQRRVDSLSIITDFSK